MRDTKHESFTAGAMARRMGVSFCAARWLGKEYDRKAWERGWNCQDDLYCMSTRASGVCVHTYYGYIEA